MKLLTYGCCEGIGTRDKPSTCVSQCLLNLLSSSVPGTGGALPPALWCSCFSAVLIRGVGPSSFGCVPACVLSGAAIAARCPHVGWAPGWFCLVYILPIGCGVYTVLVRSVDRSASLGWAFCNLWGVPLPLVSLFAPGPASLCSVGSYPCSRVPHIGSSLAVCLL